MICSRFSRVLAVLVMITFLSCSSETEVKMNAVNSYTINFDGVETYGTFDNPWMPTGSDWEIEIGLVWDSSVGANVYPIASNNSSTSIYIDSSGLALLKYENSYITANVSRLQSGEFSTIKFSVSATEVKCYFNDVLEKTVSTTKSLTVPWTVVGAHSSYSGKHKGQIRKIVLTDLADSTNSRTLDLTSSTGSENDSLSQSTLRAETGIDFILSSSDSIVKF